MAKNLPHSETGFGVYRSAQLTPHPLFFLLLYLFVVRGIVEKSCFGENKIKTLFYFLSMRIYCFHHVEHRFITTVAPKIIFLLNSFQKNILYTGL
jgi:hypothetical protein